MLQTAKSKTKRCGRKVIRSAVAAALMGVSTATLLTWLRKPARRPPHLPEPIRYTRKCFRFFEDEILAYIENRGAGHVAT